jgi:capsule polysaccharide export protein KpsE/RkpR
LSKLLSRLAVTEAQQRRLFFEKQLATAKEKLINAELALRSTGVAVSVLKSSPAAAVEGVARLKAGIVAQEIKLASMRGYLAETAFEFKQAQFELAAMRSQMAKLESGDAAPQRGDSGGDYITKYREFKYFETLFELFSKQYEIARVDESRESAVIQVVDVAVAPELKSKPQKAQIALLAGFTAGFALLLFVFIRQAVRSSGADPLKAEKLKRLRIAFRSALGLRATA